MKLYRKGKKREYKTRDLLIADGFFVVRSAGSKGAFDLVAFNSESVRLVQIKANKWPGRSEIETMATIPIPPNATREVWRWNDHAREPQIRILK